MEIGGNRQKIHGYKKLIIFTKNGNEKIRHFYLTLKTFGTEKKKIILEM